MKDFFKSRLHFNNYNVGTDTFLRGQNKPGQILTIIMYISAHNQDKPLPAGTLD